MNRRVLVAFCAMLSGCMPPAPQDFAAIDAAVTAFHERQAASQDDLIYRDAAPEFRGAGPPDILVRLNQAVRAVPGCGQSTRDPANVQWVNSTGGNFVTVYYNRDCQTGPLQEQFRFKLENTAPLLIGYNVSGMALFPAVATPATATDTATTTSTLTTTSPAP